MKKTLVSTVLVALAGVTLFSFKAPKADATLSADLSKSKIQWIGKKVTGKHEGFVSISSGSVVSDGKVVKGGSFEIDLTTITNTDLTDKEWNGKLVGHLKGEDFFDVAKFPKANFVISSVVPKGGSNYEVAGKLTIKGITQDIKFPAVITATATGVNATASIKIDRLKFNIKYGSKNIFKEIGDKAIDDEFELKLTLVAGK